MRSTRFITTTVVGLAAFVAACADSPTSIPTTAVRASTPSAAVISSVTSTPTVEQFKVCKVGSSATFSYTVDFVSTSINDQSGTLTLQDGECASIAQVGGVGANVTVTETVPQTGYQLTSVDVATIAAASCIGGTTTTQTIAGPTASGLIKGTSGSPAHCLGITATFNNEMIPVGEIGDFVWEDTNNNGTQDSGEPGIPGIVVTLGGDATATATTDATGKYLFTGLSAGDYTVTTSCPTGYATSPSDQGSDDALDSEASPASVNLAANNSTDYTIDFGCVPPTGRIGDFVWEDVNGNGIQDGGEPGIPGIVVTLGGAATGTATTDASGYYIFTGLTAGDYTVTVGAGPATYTASPADQGADDAVDSDGTAPVNVTLPANNSVDLTIDFGFVPPRPPEGGCTRTIGFWKTHAGFTGRNVDVVSQYLPIWLGTVGGTNSVQVTTAAQAVSILSMTGGSSNGIVKLQAQLLGAKLNLAAGASASAVSSTIAAADAFLAANSASAWSSMTSAQKVQVNAWMTALDNYNNGVTGPGHCG